MTISCTVTALGLVIRTLYLLAKTFKEGSMIPPRNRKTKCKVDSFWML